MTSFAASYRAWSWQQGNAPQELVLENRSARPLADDEVWVKNEVIGLNPVDWKVLGSRSWQPGKVPGCDGAGTVVAVGANVSTDWLGKKVAYHQSLHAEGSFAEFTPVASRALLAMPKALDFATAASFPCPGLTAWQAINKLPHQQGDKLVIAGAGGAVGHYLLQLAKRLEWQVTVLCHPRHWPRLTALGADACVESPEALLAQGERRSAVIDAVNEASAKALLPALKANGHLLCIQGRLSQWPTDPFGLVLSMHEVALGALHVFGDDEAWQQLSATGQALLGELASGQLAPESLHVNDFNALPKALEALKQRSFSGKSLVRVCFDKESV